MRTRDVGLATLPPVLWAATYTVAKPAMVVFPPLLLMSIVYGLTAVALCRPWARHRTPSWSIVVSATLGATLQSALIFNGIARVPASAAILTVQTQVPFAVLAAWALGQESLDGRRLAGIAVSLAGVGLVVGLPRSPGEISGLFLIVMGTVCWGAAQGIIRRTAKDAGGKLMGAISAVAALQMLVLSCFLEAGQLHAVVVATPLDWVLVAVMAIGGFVVAYSIWYGLLRRYRVDQIAPFALLMPAVGIVMAYIGLHERPTLYELLGALVIVAGLRLVVSAPNTLKENRPAPP